MSHTNWIGIGDCGKEKDRYPSIGRNYSTSFDYSPSHFHSIVSVQSSMHPVSSLVKGTLDLYWFKDAKQKAICRVTEETVHLHKWNQLSSGK